MSSEQPKEQPTPQTTEAEAPIKDPTTAKAAVEQFDKEFQRYTTKQTGKSARAVALARAELAKCTAVLWQDKKLEQAKAKKGRLSPEQRAYYEKRVQELERALDTFHRSVASVNRTKAVMSVALLLIFALAAFFTPWRKYFDPEDDYDALDRDL